MAFLDTILFLGGVKKLFFQKQNAGIVMFLFGVIWCFSIITDVPRMWGFYLWPGLTLLVYGFVLTVSNDVNELPFPTRRLLNIFALSIACLFYVNFLIDGTSHYKNFQKRSSSPQHFVQIARMDAVIGLWRASQQRKDLHWCIGPTSIPTSF